MQTKHSTLTSESEAEVLAAVSAAIQSVQDETGFGSIEITIHAGRVTQIERREKVRFEPRKTALKD